MERSHLLFPQRESTSNLRHLLLRLDKESSIPSADHVLDWDRYIYHQQLIYRIVPLSSSKHIDINQKIDNRIFLESYDFEHKGLIYTYRKKYLLVMKVCIVSLLFSSLLCVESSYPNKQFLAQAIHTDLSLMVFMAHVKHVSNPLRRHSFLSIKVSKQYLSID